MPRMQVLRADPEVGDIALLPDVRLLSDVCSVTDFGSGPVLCIGTDIGLLFDARVVRDLRHLGNRPAVGRVPGVLRARS